MNKTGRYKRLNLIFGICPFLAAVLLTRMSETSSQIELWLSIVCVMNGLPHELALTNEPSSRFLLDSEMLSSCKLCLVSGSQPPANNTRLTSCELVALLAHLPQSVMAVGTGFAQLFRGIGTLYILSLLNTSIECDVSGQVGGVAVSSALFQTVLNQELRKRIEGDDAEQASLFTERWSIGLYTDGHLVQWVTRIRHSATLVATLPPELQRIARDSYAASLKAVFTMAAVSTLLAYLARLPVRQQNFALHVERRD